MTCGFFVPLRNHKRHLTMASNPALVQDYFFIEDVDDRDYIAELVRVTCKELPLAKPKRK